MEIKFFGGESTVIKFFLGGEVRSSIFGWWVEALFQPVSKKNPAVFAQFDPKFQSPISHDSLCRCFFNLNVLEWWSILDRQKHWWSTSQKSLRLNPKIIHPYILWYCCIMMGYTKKTKLIPFNWSLVLGEMGNLSPICPTIVTLYVSWSLYVSWRIFWRIVA